MQWQCTPRRELLEPLLSNGHAWLQEDIVCTAYIAALYLHNKQFKGKVFVLGNPAMTAELDACGIQHTGVGVSVWSCRRYSVYFLSGMTASQGKDLRKLFGWNILTILDGTCWDKGPFWGILTREVMSMSRNQKPNWAQYWPGVIMSLGHSRSHDWRWGCKVKVRLQYAKITTLCVCVCMHVCVCMRACVCMHCVCVHACAYACAYMHACMCVCVCVYLSVCLFVIV